MAQTKSGPITCPDQPKGNSSNACANTRFVINNGGGGGGGSPGGSNGQVQFNSTGSFAGATNIYYDSVAGFTGFNTSSPTYQLMVVPLVSGRFPFHIPTSSGFPDTGLWMGSRGGSFADLYGGATFDGTNFIAKSTAASGMTLDNAHVTFNCNSGLSVSGTFTPTPCATIRSDRSNFVGTVALNADYASGSEISSSLQTALANFREVKLPCGTFNVASAIGFTVSSTVLRGSGQCTVLQNTNSASFAVLSGTDVNDITIRDLTIDGGNAGDQTACISFSGSLRVRVENITCQSAPNGGISLAQDGGGNGSHYGIINNVYINNMANTGGGAHSIELSLSDHVVISNVTMEAVDNGINIAGSNYATVNSISIKGIGSTKGFAGVRCTDNSNFAAVSSVSVTAMSRGLFLLGCNYSTFNGFVIENTQQEPVLIQATNIGGIPISSPTQGNSIMGVVIRNGCLAGTCDGGSAPQPAVLFNVNGVAANQVTNNTIAGINVVIAAGSITQAVKLSGVTAALNKCDANTSIANVTYGSC